MLCIYDTAPDTAAASDLRLKWMELLLAANTLEVLDLVDADAVKQLYKRVQEVNDFNSSALLEAELKVIAELVRSLPSE